MKAGACLQRRLVEGRTHPAVGHGAESLVVPARALADEAARDFVTLARERIAQAAAA
jgi:hypothetical protein